MREFSSTSPSIGNFASSAPPHLFRAELPPAAGRAFVVRNPASVKSPVPHHQMATLTAASARVGRCARVCSRAATPAAAAPVPISHTVGARRLCATPSGRGCKITTHASNQSSPDAIYRVTSANQEVSVISIVGTSVVSDAVTRHKTAPTASAALGRTMLAATLLGTFKGDDETTQITFKGDGPIGQIIAISDNTGQVKGMCSNPNADPPLRADGKLNVGGAVGKGILSVSRAHPNWKAPFNGMVQITTGEIAEDIAVYLQESEQVNSAIAVGVSLDRDLNVLAAGGYMVQVLPFASDETIAALEQSIPNLPSTTDMIAGGMTAQGIAERVLGSLGTLAEVATTSTPSYGPCDPTELRGRMMRALASMGKEEIQSIIEEQGKVEVTCEFCKDAVVFTQDELLGAKDEV